MHGAGNDFVIINLIEEKLDPACASELCVSGQGARCKDIAARMSVSKPSAHSTIQNLCDLGLAEKQKYGAVHLTEQGISDLSGKVDSLIIIPNDRLKYVTDQKITFANAFGIADDVLKQAVTSISELVGFCKNVIINLAFSTWPATSANGPPRPSPRAWASCRTTSTRSTATTPPSKTRTR